jgi:surface protein
MEKATFCNYMFSQCTSFNGNITNWNTEKIGYMLSMFYNATAFNQPLNWDTSNVVTMTNMFSNATSFNQDISNFKMNSLAFWQNPPLEAFLNNTAMNISNVDKLLIKWGQDVSAGQGPIDMSLGLNDVSYSGSNPLVTSLMDNYGWTYDGGISA